MIVDTDIWPGERSGSWLCSASPTLLNQPANDKARPPARRGFSRPLAVHQRHLDESSSLAANWDLACTREILLLLFFFFFLPPVKFPPYRWGSLNIFQKKKWRGALRTSYNFRSGHWPSKPVTNFCRFENDPCFFVHCWHAAGSLKVTGTNWNKQHGNLRNTTSNLTSLNISSKHYKPAGHSPQTPTVTLAAASVCGLFLLLFFCGSFLSVWWSRFLLLSPVSSSIREATSGILWNFKG